MKRSVILFAALLAVNKMQCFLTCNAVGSGVGGWIDSSHNSGPQRFRLHDGWARTRYFFGSGI